MEFSELSNRVIGCAIEVHRRLGPRLLESTYEQCLAHELKLSGIRFKLPHSQAVDYKGVRLDCGYRADVLVEDKLYRGTACRKKVPLAELDSRARKYVSNEWQIPLSEIKNWETACSTLPVARPRVRRPDNRRRHRLRERRRLTYKAFL